MILDLVPQHNKASGNEREYELLRVLPGDGEHEVAWMKCIWLNQPTEKQPTYLLACECDFTEGIGWYIGSDECYYEDPEEARRRCSYRQLAIQHRYQELRELCRLSDNPSDEELVGAIRTLLGEASKNRMIGDEYESSYFSLQTFMDITKASMDQAFEVTDRIYQTKTACFDGRDLVTYKEPMWLLYQKVTVTTSIESDTPDAPPLSAVLTLYKPLHGHMPPKWRCELRYSDQQDPPIVRYIWIEHLNKLSEEALTQGQFNDKFEHFRKRLKDITSKIDSLQSF